MSVQDAPGALGSNDGGLTFVCCVESGLLEDLTVRLIESLRRHGGRFSQANVIAVTPRFGPTLTSGTLRQFARLEVRHLRVKTDRDYGWYHFLNKPMALLAAEGCTDAQTMAFLDSDVLVLGEPSELALNAEEDFAICAPDTGVVGSTGRACVYDRAWGSICDVFGLKPDDLPWITTYAEQERIRLYWNSGVFSYRRSTGFALNYLAACKKLLSAKISFPGNTEHYIEQASLGPIILQNRMKWRMLGHSHNYAVGSFLPQTHRPDMLSFVKILHYHDAMSANFWPTFAGLIEQSHPACWRWLAPLGPARNPASPMSRALAEALRVVRGVPRWRYRRRVAASMGAGGPLR